MLSNLSNNNAGNQTKSVVEKKHYEEIENRLDEMQDEIDANTESINQNAQDISGLDERVDAVENNSTFPTLNTDTINPATGDKVEIVGDLDVDGKVTADSIETDALSVNGVDFTTVKDNAAQAKSIAENAENKADEAYDLADALSDELADYKADNEASITTATLNADSADIDSIASRTINTNDFETTNAEIDDLYVDRIHATGELALPTIGQSYYTITVPAGTIASFAGSYITENDEIEYFYFTVTDGDVIYHQAALEVIKDISFDRETGNTKIRVKSTGAVTYISSSMNVADPTIEDGGSAYEDFSFIPQKLGGQIIRGYNDTTTETFVAGVLNAYAITADEIHYERTVVDDLIVNAAIELPKEWNQSGNISRSSGTKGQYISIQTKDGVDKPTWTDPVNNPIGSLSYSDKLIDEATMAAYKGISETRQTRTINVVDEASLNQLSAYLWTKNNGYWQPYEKTRITIGDHTLWIDSTESNQGIRFYDGMVIADGTWDDSPVEEANTPPVNIVIYDAPTELSYPITNLGDKTIVHGEITATCFKGNVLGNVTGNADTATNATCFNNKTYAETKEDILSGTANNATCFDGCTYADAKADILSGTANNATCFDGCTYECAKADILNGTANNATCFAGCTYAEAKTDILSGCAAEANNATCFGGCTYNCAKADILSGTADNTTCFDGCTYACAKADILSGNAASATNSTCFNGCTYEQAKDDIRNYTPSYATCTSCPIIHATTDTVATQHVVPFAKYTHTTNDETPLNCDNCLTYTTVQQRLSTPNLCVSCCAEIISAQILCLQTYNTIDGKACEACCSTRAQTVFTSGSSNTHKLLSSTCGWSTPLQTDIDYCLDSNTLSNANIDISGCSLKAKTACFTGNVDIDCNVSIGGNLTVTGTLTGTAKNATCFNGKTYACAKADILTGTAANSTCFGGCTYSEAKADILSGTAAQAHCVDIDSLTTSSYPLVMESATCELGKSGTCSITFAPSTGILETSQVSTACIENSGTIQSCNFCATNDVNIDGNTYITGDLTVLGTTTTTHSEEVVTPSENILLRDTATTPISSGCYSGFIVKNYDGSNNDLEVGANSDGTLHVGVVGGTMEPVATRATEACMENDYVAHWDSTGIDLVTKGASCTHDLCVNGNATVTGTLTANLTGNADTATNATCFNGCTYVCAKADILSGNASSATNATCFDGCTYSQAKADILSGNAASATNSTCFNGCTYSQAKSDILTGTAKNATCFGGCTYAQAKADILTGTAKNATCFNGCTYECAKADILSGTATNATCFNGCTYAQAKADILTGCAANSNKLAGFTYAEACANILSGNAASASYATKVVPFSDSTNEEKNLAFFNCNVACGYPDTIQYDSGKQLTFNPVTNNLTVAGDVQAKNTVRRGDYYNISSANINKYVLLAQASYAYNGNHDITISGYLTGANSNSVGDNRLLNRFSLAARSSGTGVSGVTFRLLHTDDGNYKATYEFDATTHNLTVRIYGKISIQYQRLKIAIDTFTKGDVYPFVSTYDSALTLPMTVSDAVTGTEVPTSYLTVNNSTCFDGHEASYFINNSSTAQTKAGNLSIGAPAACTSTSAGGTGNILGSTGIDIYGSTSLPHIHFHNNKYCGEYSARIANTTGRVALTVNNGTGCTEATESKTFDFCSDGTFKGATNICGTNIYQSGNKVIDESSTLQCKAGCLYIGAPASCTTTSAGGAGIQIKATGGIDLFHNTNPFVQFHAQKSNAYSAIISNIYDPSDCRGRVAIGINDGHGCSTPSTTCWYNFYSNGTFSGASTICASCNIYSAGCPVVTTGNIATVAPGYNCTGTSNYVVTTMVCCAKAVCRTPTHADCNYHVTLFAGNTAVNNAGLHVADTCPLTYNPAAGILTACCIDYRYSPYRRTLANPGNIVTYALVCWLDGAKILAAATNDLEIEAYDAKYLAQKSGCLLQALTGSVYGRICTAAIDGTGNDGDKTWIRYQGWRNVILSSSTRFCVVCCTTTAPTDVTWVSPSWECRASNVYNTPTSASTTCNVTITAGCCSATAPTNYTWCFCGCNGEFRSPGDIYVGSGSDGTNTAYSMIKEGTLEVSRDTPALDLHFNCYCGNYSTRLVNNAQGSAQLIVNNGDRTTAATQTATYCFCSNGIMTANCLNTAAIRSVNPQTSTTSNLTFMSRCCNALEATNFCMCMCGSNGKLYNPQGFMVGSCPVALLCDVPTLPPQPTQEDHYTVACYECGTTNVVTLSWDNSVCKTSDIFNLIMTCGKICCMIDCITEWNRVCTIKYCEYPDISIVGVMSIPRGDCATCIDHNFDSIKPVGVYAGKRCTSSMFNVRYGTIASNYFSMYSSDSTNECCGTVWMLGGGTVTITTPKITV